MTRLFITLILVLCISSPISLYAQVTIGSDLKPAQGALLDLKGHGHTQKGLGLPRVKLINNTPTNSTKLAESIGGTGEWDMDKHIGLIIYNMTEGTGECINDNYSLEGVPREGIHVWNGEKWQNMSPVIANREKDVRTLVDHGMSTIDSLRVGSFTMSYNNGTYSENETYYYADFETAGIWMTQNLRTQYTPQGIRLEMTGVQTSTGKEPVTNKLLKRGAYPSSQDVTDPSDYNLNRANGKDVGLLYDWYTATDHHNCITTANQAQVGLLSDSIPTPGAMEVESREADKFIRGICPEGWHIPSDREWTQLEKHLTQNASRYTQDPPTPNSTWDDTWETAVPRYRGTISGTVMKSKINVENSSEATNGNSKTEQNGGFNSYQTGAKTDSSPPTIAYGSLAYMWSSSNATSVDAWYRALTSAEKGTFRGHSDRNYFFSVRCKKNK